MAPPSHPPPTPTRRQQLRAELEEIRQRQGAGAPGAASEPLSPMPSSWAASGPPGAAAAARAGAGGGAWGGAGDSGKGGGGWGRHPQPALAPALAGASSLAALAAAGGPTGAQALAQGLSMAPIGEGQVRQCCGAMHGRRGHPTLERPHTVESHCLRIKLCVLGPARIGKPINPKRGSSKVIYIWLEGPAGAKAM